MLQFGPSWSVRHQNQLFYYLNNTLTFHSGAKMWNIQTTGAWFRFKFLICRVLFPRWRKWVYWLSCCYSLILDSTRFNFILASWISRFFFVGLSQISSRLQVLQAKVLITWVCCIWQWIYSHVVPYMISLRLYLLI